MAFAGLVATAVGDLIMAPIDTIKTVQQAASGSSALSMVGASRLLMQRAPSLPPARRGPCPPMPPRHDRPQRPVHPCRRCAASLCPPPLHSRWPA